MQHGPIPESLPRGWIRSVEQGLHFLLDQIRHQPSVGLLEGDRQNATHLPNCGWLTVLQKPEERPDGSQADVSRLRGIATCGLQMLQERADQRGVQLLQHQSRRRHLEFLRGELEQTLEAVGVRIASVSAGATLADQILAEECLHVRCERGHWRPPCTKFSATRAMSSRSSGVVSRYQ